MIKLNCKLWKNGAIWCILKCILIQFQGKNSLNISVFIATNTKKISVFLNELRVVTRRIQCIKLNSMYFKVYFMYWASKAVIYFGECTWESFEKNSILIIFQSKISMFITTTMEGNYGRHLLGRTRTFKKISYSRRAGHYFITI